MREYKFRAWGSFPADKPMQMHGDWQALEYIEDVGFDGGQFFEVMQYTGFKDCKRTEKYPGGQEIYEGDIMHLRSIRRGELATYWPAAVVFSRYGEWKIGFPPDGQGQSLWYRWVLDNESEVIGNIYENPELLKAND